MKVNSSTPCPMTGRYRLVDQALSKAAQEEFIPVIDSAEGHTRKVVTASDGEGAPGPVGIEQIVANLDTNSE
jgi:hypothetical protein